MTTLDVVMAAAVGVVIVLVWCGLVWMVLWLLDEL